MNGFDTYNFGMLLRKKQVDNIRIIDYINAFINQEITASGFLFNPAYVINSIECTLTVQLAKIFITYSNNTTHVQVKYI